MLKDAVINFRLMKTNFSSRPNNIPMHPQKAAPPLFSYAICGFFYLLQLLKMGNYIT